MLNGLDAGHAPAPRAALVAALAPHARHASALHWTGLGGASGSVPWNIVVLLTLLTLAPALLVSLTPFTRLLIAFHFLRQALGDIGVTGVVQARNGLTHAEQVTGSGGRSAPACTRSDQPLRDGSRAQASAFAVLTSALALAAGTTFNGLDLAGWIIT